MARFEAFGVEHIPELQKDEYREENGQLFETELAGRSTPVEQHTEQYADENRSAGKDRPGHGRCDDKLVFGTRRFVHHRRIGRQGSHRQRSESVHDDIDPQNLHYRKRHLGPENRTYENHDDRREIDRQLKQYETLDIAVERTPPHHGRCDRRKRIVEQRDVAGILRHRRTRSHRESHVSEIQRRCIVRTVTRYSHDFALALQKTHEPLLVERSRPGHNLQSLHPLEQLLVAHRRELHARHFVP